MKITIITVCYNSGKTIEDTIKSVLNQSYTNYEYLIIDGNSKDNTMDIVKKYEKKFKGKMKYISEKDKGLYDAMNKGIKMATGDIIGIINSDDILANNNVFEKIISNFTVDYDAIYGDVLYCNQDFTEAVRNYKSGPVKNVAVCPAHPTLYCRKEIFEKIGLYNLNYKVSADYDFLVRLNKSMCKYNYVHDYFVLMRIGGTSNGFKGYLHNFKDAYLILKNNDVSFPLTKTLGRTIHTFNQIIVAKFSKKSNQNILYNLKEKNN